MTDDTIIGNGPGGRSPGPDAVVPGMERAAGRAHRDDAAASGRPRRDLPGDPTTAYHRGQLYGLLAVGFDRPGEAFQAAVDAEALQVDLVDAGRAIDDDVASTARTVAPLVEDAAALTDEWTALFGIEEGVPVSPYELTYLPGPLMTNVRKLADLGGFYEAFDLEIVAERRTRPDHLCYLLEFLSQLSLREAYLRLEEDDEGVAIVGDARRQFVEDHLGRWYWRFAEEVSQHGDGFYARLADVLAALLEDEIDRLDVTPAWVPDNPEVTEWTEDIFGDSGRGCGGCGIDHGSRSAGDDAAPGPTGPAPGDRRDTGQEGDDR